MGAVNAKNCLRIGSSSPTTAELAAIGRSIHLELTESETDQLVPAIDALLTTVEELRAVEGIDTPPPAGKRSAGRRPTAGEDPHNAFIQFCDVFESEVGSLAGVRAGVKDNIDVAGVPTSNGSSLPAYMPTRDAVVVERMLACGGRIVGKLNMDGFGYGASGESSAFGAPTNPRDARRSAGGSSGGSGAAVASGAVDVALGVDQGGSARIPASLCGVVAIKATHGLVPSQGASHIDHTLDHVCPMASSVDMAVVLLEAIAGDDWRDPQWTRRNIPQVWRAAQGQDIASVRVGIVVEAADPTLCSPDVLDALRNAAFALERAGAIVSQISIPLWSQGLAIAQTLQCHLIGAMIASEGVGYGHLGVIDVERLAAFASNRRRENRQLPPIMKALMLVERYLHEKHLNADYGHLHNLRLRLRRDIMAALEPCDVLLTPTTPSTAPELLDPDTVVAAMSRRMLRTSHDVPAPLPYNTAQLNLSGHPAIALPSGVDRAGLPTSVQVIARHFEDGLAIRIARVIEADQL